MDFEIPYEHRMLHELVARFVAQTGETFGRTDDIAEQHREGGGVAHHNRVSSGAAR